MTVIEWYILRALYERDGQHASELAQAVGRAATSFTPNLDKLQDKGYIERRPDRTDRRAVRIYLTEKALQNRDNVLDSAESLDAYLGTILGSSELDTFNRVMAQLQELERE